MEHTFRNFLFDTVSYEMMSPVAIIIGLVISYIIGSIPFGLILTQLFQKQDIRKIGSGNIGATNVLRGGNKLLAFFTLLLDTLKSWLAVIYASMFVVPVLIGFCDEVDCIPEFCFCYPNVVPAQYTLPFGLVAIIGHCFPIWLKFRGGKGVATALGVLLAAVPWVGLTACGVWLASAFAFKISSLAALIAIGSAPIVTFFIYGSAPAGVCLLIALLVFWRHKDNIQRLLKGDEPKIGKKNN